MKNQKIDEETQQKNQLNNKQTAGEVAPDDAMASNIDEQLDVFADIIVELILNEQNEKAQPRRPSSI